MSTEADALAAELARAYADWQRRNLVAPAIPDAAARAVFAAGWNYGHFSRRVPPPGPMSELPQIEMPA